jgi:prepilin-type N-terminal cleavage/methylation domain-containing protein
MIQKKKGMTLIEMMMAIAIALLAMGGFTLLFFKGVQTNSFVIEEGNAALYASRAIDTLVSDLRKVRQGDNGDYPIVSVASFDLKVYSDIDNDSITERVHYYLEDTTLKRGVAKPIAGTPVIYPANDTEVSVLANAIVNTPNEPLFSFYNKDYPSDTIHNPMTGSIALNDIRLVRVWVHIDINPQRASNDINIESFAELRNLNDY